MKNKNLVENVKFILEGSELARKSNNYLIEAYLHLLCENIEEVRTITKIFSRVDFNINSIVTIKCRLQKKGFYISNQYGIKKLRLGIRKNNLWNNIIKFIDKIF